MYFECSECWIVIEAAHPPARCPNCREAGRGFIGVEGGCLQLHLLARRFQRELASQVEPALGSAAC